MNRALFSILVCGAVVCSATKGYAQSTLLPYGDMNRWETRIIKESGIIGGKKQKVYEIAPTTTIEGDIAYKNKGGSPWATSNVLAHVSGITKTSTTVFPEERGNGYCAKLSTDVQTCKVLGIINIKVLAAGCIYLGSMEEPIKSTSNPQSKLNSGIPFTKTPKALCFDYKVKLSGQLGRIRETGFSAVKKIAGKDMPEASLFLQKRWEDSEGNIHALRVGSMVVRFDQSTGDWRNNQSFTINYGDLSKEVPSKPYLALQAGKDARYAINSKGKSVPINEEGWAPEGTQPTHLILQFSSSYGGAYIGSPGTILWVDNIGFQY
ncbi:PCMD domain-containing protein [Porphyromonas pogonae]|uniref:PCMD domain-containing protein n=1 Tax=Porphyromonas pogonae TaxID=867595 RepID=UPI002E75B8B8|nr:PCMD domain-containing protein [Porphyromonas pogonae]